MATATATGRVVEKLRQQTGGKEVVVVKELTKDLKGWVRDLLLENPRLTAGQLPALLRDRHNVKVRMQ